MKDLTLAKRIGLGFAALLIITTLLGGLTLIEMRTVGEGAHKLSEQYVPEVAICAALESATHETRLAVRTFVFNSDPKAYEQAEAGLKAIQEGIVQAKDLAAKYPTLVKLKEDISGFESTYQQFARMVAETRSKIDALNQAREGLNASADQFVTAVEAFQNSQQRAMQEDMNAGLSMEKLQERVSKVELLANVRTIMNQVRIATWKAQAGRDLGAMTVVLPKFGEMAEIFGRLDPIIRVEFDQQQLATLRTAAKDYQDDLQSLAKVWQELDDLGVKRAEANAILSSTAAEIAKTGIQRTTEVATESSKTMDLASLITLIGVLVATVVGVLTASFITRGITRVVRAIGQSLSAGADETAAASNQVSSASQMLAEGASEQAASLEETGASLEEITSMVKRNAEAAAKAKALANETRAAADAGTIDMDEMTHAMNDIKASSDDIAKIIKSIDEIAFQTNILALNAAVEAARAGEAGMGFAVVAEEVRNLAQRCASSAKETATKIEAAVVKSERGVQISAKVAANFSLIATKTRDVDQYVAEISTASNEQAQGVGQVNLAVVQMEKVTQGNAASAEETASAAEELNAQAEAVQEAAAELQKLIGGNKTHSLAARKQPASVRPTRPAGKAARASDAVVRSGQPVATETPLTHAAPRARRNGDRHGELVAVQGNDSFTSF